MSNLKVLMAEDEPEVLEVMRKKISSEGFDVVTAADGEEAWSQIQAESPDVILLDLTMPKRSGFEVLEELRKAPPDPKKWQPVIIISAHDELESMQRGFDLEADHYITKPCQMADVLKAIRLMVNLIPQRKIGELD